jgi:diadenosine tetraphosphatase ApaH/serine/threonine PP2A family protein phosphatase
MAAPVRESYYKGGGLDFEEIRVRLSKGRILGEEEVNQILDSLVAALIREETVIFLQSPIIICGDLHGQFEDVELLLQLATTDVRTDRFLFMGDYVDRGNYSLNTFLLLATLKLQYPAQYFLLRGNHESRQVTQQYGFHSEVLRSYGHSGIWARCMHAFDLLPYAAVVDNDVFSVHGGISPKLVLLEELNKKRRVREIPTAGMLADLAWSDPEDQGLKGFRANQRGAGYLFGRDALREFCYRNGLKLVTRSHQLVMEGYKWYFGEQNEEFPGQLINVWSAPNYAYQSKNVASFLKLRYPGQPPAVLPCFSDRAQRIAVQEAEISKYFA